MRHFLSFSLKMVLRKYIEIFSDLGINFRENLFSW